MGDMVGPGVTLEKEDHKYQEGRLDFWRGISVINKKSWRETRGMENSKNV